MDFLHYLADALTKNWGLKVLALLLAIALYYGLKPSVHTPFKNHERTFFQSAEPAK